MCTGGLLTHSHCLTTFLNVKVRKQRLKPNKLSCEICNQDYEVEVTPTCSISLEHCKRKISSNHMRCAIYSLFFLVALLFYALMSFLFLKHPLSDVARVVLIIVAVCLFLMFVLFLGVWLYEYLFKTDCDNIGRVLTLEEHKFRSLPRSLKVHPQPSLQQLN